MQFTTKTTIAIALSLGAASSFAHINYTNRDFGTLDNGDNVTIANMAITGNYGWADAADSALSLNAALGDQTGIAGVDNLKLGDTHKARAFRLHLDSTLTVTFTAAAKADATPTSIGGLLPGFSVYQGLAAIAPFAPPVTSADHDFSVASTAWRDTNFGAGNTQGSWNAKGDFKIGGDGDPAGVDGALTSFHFIGYAEDADNNGVATGSFLLGPGDYTVFVSGNDITNKGSANFSKAYGLSLSVSAVPEPQTWLLMLLGAPLLARRLRRTA